MPGKQEGWEIFLLQWEGRISVESCFSRIDAGRGGRVRRGISWEAGGYRGQE
jgi:hypothetical protein